MRFYAVKYLFSEGCFPDLIQIKERGETVKNIVIAVDGSDASKGVVNYALQFAAKEKDVKLLFIHVIESQEYQKFSFHGLTVDVLPREDEVKGKFAKFIEEEICASGIEKPNMSIHTATGVPYFQIVSFAEEQSADMIMIGHRGMSDIELFFLGSVASKVVMHAPCSVFVHRIKKPIAEELPD